MVKIYICPYCGRMSYYRSCTEAQHYRPHIYIDDDGAKHVEWDLYDSTSGDCDPPTCENCDAEMYIFEVDNDFAYDLVKAKRKDRIFMMIEYIVKHTQGDVIKNGTHRCFIIEALGIDDRDIDFYAKLVRELGDARKAYAMLKVVKA